MVCRDRSKMWQEEQALQKLLAVPLVLYLPFQKENPAQ